MKIILILVILAPLVTRAQFRNAPSPNQYLFNYSIIPSPEKTFIHGLLADPIQNNRQVPMLTNLSHSDWRAQNNFFWTGTVTTMSFNKGRFGTFYYWDIQGNLRGTRGFIDISGKNKRGFKLVFPWRKF